MLLVIRIRCSAGLVWMVVDLITQMINTRKGPPDLIEALVTDLGYYISTLTHCLQPSLLRSFSHLASRNVILILAKEQILASVSVYSSNGHHRATAILLGPGGYRETVHTQSLFFDEGTVTGDMLTSF